MGRMQRRESTLSVTIANTANLSGAFDNRIYAMGVVRMPAAWTAASLGFKVAEEESGTYLPLYDDNGILVQIDSPAVDCAYSFPAEVAACSWIKLWSQDGSGGDTAQGAERTIGVDLKS